MKTNPDSKPDDVLLDAVLRDENWQTASAALKAEALVAFHARQHRRQLARWASVVALVAIAASAVHWLNRPAAVPSQLAAHRAEEPKRTENPRFLTDKELIALFPDGSCFIAEVDGRKELVFLDSHIESLYVARLNESGN